MIETDADVGEREDTYVAVTPRGKRWGKEDPPPPPEEEPPQRRTRVRARDRVASWRREKTAEEFAAPDITESATGGKRSFWRDGPAPAADLVAYTRSGAWLRGQRNDLLERAGKVWGYAVALPLTLLLGALIWSVHRFHRALVLAIVVAVLWVSAPAWGESAPAVPQIGATTP